MRESDMFSVKNLIVVTFVGYVMYKLGMYLDGQSLCVNNSCSIMLPMPGNLLATYGFIIAVFGASMFVWRFILLGLVSLPGLSSEKEEPPLTFTWNELIQMDKEDAPVYNENARAQASVGWAGGYSGNPTYFTYDGREVDVFKNTYTGLIEPLQDKRHIVNGKINHRVYKIRPIPTGSGCVYHIEH